MTFLTICGSKLMKRKKLALQSIHNYDLDDSIKSFVVEYIIDHDHRRAARTAGICPQWAVNLLNTELVQLAVKTASESLYGGLEITSETLQEELFMAYNVAMQGGKLTTAAKLLDSIAKLATIDAFAANKIAIESDSDFLEELRKGRERMNELQKAATEH